MRSETKIGLGVGVGLVVLAGPVCLGQSGGAVERETVRIGETAGGRAIVVHRISAAGEDGLGRGPDERPAVAVIAGLDARHRVGRDVALGLAERLVDGGGEALEGRTVYVLPAVNLDGFAAKGSGDQAGMDWGRGPRSGDADRDGRMDEDPADDVNGDGLVTMMLVEEPAEGFGGWRGVEAAWVIDEDDARVVREPDGDAGEIATHALLIEGVDDDGDGAFNEDGAGGTGGGGVELWRNYPSLWPELEERAGLYPASEPETRAVIEWLQSRDNIAALVVYGPGDNLANVPGTKGFDESGRMPKGLEAGDLAAFERVAELYTETTGIEKAETHDPAGSLTAWAYNDLGVWSFRSVVWARPEAEKEEKKDGDDAVAEEAGAAEEEARDPNEVERERLVGLGVDPRLIEFLTVSAEERAELMAGFESMAPEEQQSMMEAVSRAPADVQARVMAIAQGGVDPGPPDVEGGAEATSQEKPKKKGKPKESETTRWLAYFDRRVEEGGEPGFVEWAEHEHPQFGDVLIGGFVPGARMNPPAGELSGLIDGQAAFVTGLVEKLPEIELGAATAERVGKGLWRVGVTVRNVGELPTYTAMAGKARRIASEVLTVSVADERVVSGDRTRRLGPIAGGASTRVEWLVSGEDGQRVEIGMRSARFGDRELSVRLAEDGR